MLSRKPIPGLNREVCLIHNSSTGSMIWLAPNRPKFSFGIQFLPKRDGPLHLDINSVKLPPAPDASFFLALSPGFLNVVLYVSPDTYY